jgi:hypothetical protein
LLLAWPKISLHSGKARTNPYPVPVVSSPIHSSSAAATGARAVWPAAKLLSAPASRRWRLRPPLRHAGPLACFVLTIQSPAVYRGGATVCACSPSPSPAAARRNQQLAACLSPPREAAPRLVFTIAGGCPTEAAARCLLIDVGGVAANSFLPAAARHLLQPQCPTS